MSRPRPPGPSRRSASSSEHAARDLARAIDRRVALRIRERRRHLGMTQLQLARRLGVAFQQAHKYEHGLSRITAGRLFFIAAALGAPISYFFEAEAEPGEPPPPAGGRERADAR